MLNAEFGATRRDLLKIVASAAISCSRPLKTCYGTQSDVPQSPQFRALLKLRERHLQLREKLQSDLEELALQCETKQLIEPAEQIRELARQAGPERQPGRELPREIQPDIPGTLPPDERLWRTELRHLRTEYARQLYLLSRNVLRGGFPSYAFHLIREVAWFDPDHPQARDILGYTRLGDEWVTPFEKSQRTSPQRFTWHDRFGWLPESYVERYEQGQRRFKSRWISAEEEAVLRQDFRNAWSVRTEHFLVKTNHSLERGVEIASRLERYRRSFYEIFAAFFNTPEQLQRLFSGSSPARRTPRPHTVHYYRSRHEYNTRLKQAIPQIEITNGLYYTPDRSAYFFDDPSNETNTFDTFYHEATHQFLYENISTHRDIAEDAHFWIIEGIACYMESFRLTETGESLGDPDHIRIRAARYRLLEDRYYIPLRSFAGMGLKEFQSDLANIQKNYSQASGLAHFFMNYGEARYRDALMAHLRQIYLPSRQGQSVETLEELTGQSYDELDRQYITYIKQLDDQIAQRP